MPNVKVTVGDDVMLPSPFANCRVFAPVRPQAQYELWPIIDARGRRLACKVYRGRSRAPMAALRSQWQRRAKGPSTMAVWAAFAAKDIVLAIEPWAHGPTLAQQIDDERAAGTIVSLKETLDRFCPLVRAMRDAHAASVLHNDIKLDNAWFLDASGKASSLRLGDFGFACLCNEPLRAGAGTTAYLAPEVMAGQSHTIASDVFALGACLVEMCTGLTPYEGDDEQETAQRLLKLQPNIDRGDVAIMLSMRGVSSGAADALATWAMHLCAPEPSMRPNGEQIERDLFAFMRSTS